MVVLNGIDRLSEKDNFGLKGKRLGLITSVTGLSADLVSTTDILCGLFDLRALFAPEHGVRGDADAGGDVKTYTDERTGLTVHSIYGGENRPTPEMLADIDALIIDIQDVGSRFYTFISTMYNAMEECAKAGKQFVVLDRINPINGVDVEGNILDMRFKSFVGIAPIPQRHGMTMGELAQFFNKDCGINCNLTVVPVSQWSRSQFGDETGMLWVNPSPNITGMDCALLYPGTCLFEGTNISEGRGTTKPFEMIGSPWLDAEKLAQTLNAQKLPGLLFRPVYFTPFASKFKDQLCAGIQAHVTDRRKIAPVDAGLRILEAIIEQDEKQFAWRPSINGKSSIDILSGSDLLRNGHFAEYYKSCKEGAEKFHEQRKPYLLY